MYSKAKKKLFAFQMCFFFFFFFLYAYLKVPFGCDVTRFVSGRGYARWKNFFLLTRK